MTKLSELFTKKRRLVVQSVVWGALILLVAIVLYSLWLSRAVAYVNGEKISYYQFKKNLDFYLNQTRTGSAGKKLPGPQGKEEMMNFRNLVLSMLIKRNIIRQGAKAQGIEVLPQEIDQQISQMSQRYPNYQAFLNDLKNHALTLNDYKDTLYWNVLEEKLKEPFGRNLSVTAKELREYYTANKRQFSIPVQFNIKHVSIKDEALAQQLGKRLASHPGDFDDVIQANSNDQISKAKKGVVGYVALNRLPPDIQKVIGNLKINQISTPIKTQYGFEIIQVLGKKPPRTITFDEMKQFGKQEILNMKKEQGYDRWYTNLTSLANVTINPL